MNTSRPPYISVVLSFWNEEENIPELIRQLRAAFGELMSAGDVRGYEFVFVNDASTDASEALLRAELPRGDIRIVNMSRNFGVAPCIMAGFAHASGDAVIYMDADLQDPPHVIPSLVRRWLSEPDLDVIHTVRSTREGESAGKMLITRIGYRVLRWSYNIDLPIEAGDFKLLSRRVVDHLVALKEKKPFIRGLVRWVGFKQSELRYKRERRFAGDTHFPVLSAKVILNFFESALLSFSEVPLRAILVAGMSILGAGILAALVLIVRVIIDAPTAGWSWVLAAVLVVGGVQILSAGILGMYLGTIFIETKHRPNYIVKELLGFEGRPEQPVADRERIDG